MMMRVKDNTVLLKTKFNTIPNLTKQIADKTIMQLEKEGLMVFPRFIRKFDDIQDDQIVLQSVNESYKTSNVMGFLGLRNERLTIQSRFSFNEQDYFFQYILEKVLDFPNMIKLDTDVNRDNQLYNVLLFVFPYYLKAALRKGTFKTYIRYNYNDSKVKGAIDIASHIKKNTPFTGIISYSQRELSFDNPLMELIRHTIEFIKTKPYGNQLLKRVQDEVVSVIEATKRYDFHNRRKIIYSNKKSPIRHAYYHEYRVLQSLCIMILQYEKHQIGSGINRIHGILFDGSWLWEQYIYTLISDEFYHPMNKLGFGVQQLFTNARGHKEGRIYPDFISKDNLDRIIADAKYKPANNIGSKDYLQVLSYMYRFDAKRGYYFYPESEGGNRHHFYLNKGSTYEHNVTKRNDIIVVKCGFVIPNAAESYNVFRRAMLESEAEFKIQFISENAIHL